MSTRSSTPLWRTVASVATGFLACGIPYWPIPYKEVSLLANPSAWVWLAGAAVAGALAAALLDPGFLRPTLYVGIGFALAVVARVLIDTVQDSSSHNLWPFEVGIAVAVGSVGGAAGAAIVRGVQRLRA